MGVILVGCFLVFFYVVELTQHGVDGLECALIAILGNLNFLSRSFMEGAYVVPPAPAVITMSTIFQLDM